MYMNINKQLLILAGLGALAVGYFAGHASVLNLQHSPAHIEALAVKDFQEGYDTQAFKLFTNLAGKGDNTAAFYLGQMYEFGDGVAVDRQEAVKWLSIAANAGNSGAARQLGLLYLDGIAGVQDFAKARKWLLAAADTGDGTALRSLGDMNREGLGAPADPVTAYAYYSVAAIKGNGYGTTMRDKLASSLSADQQRKGQDKARTILARIDAAQATAKPPATTTNNKTGAVAPSGKAGS